MKIIFLDIDGVLNHEKFFIARKAPSMNDYPLNQIDSKSVEILNSLVDKTGAKVVVSSSWRLRRHVKDLQEILDKLGFRGEIIDVTPDFELGMDGYVRGNEILKWIIDNEELLGQHQFEFDSYVILDDDEDMLYQQRHNFIRVNYKTGLTRRDVHKACKILSN